MIEPSKAAFSFHSFKVTKFQFNEYSKEDLGIELSPSGEYNENNGVYILSLNLACKVEDEDSVILSADFKARFNFEKETLFKDIPAYFYLNAVAILFPYIRAFASNLTLQANTTPLILPILNLTGLEQPLKNSTKVISLID